MQVSIALLNTSISISLFLTLPSPVKRSLLESVSSSIPVIPQRKASKFLATYANHRHHHTTLRPSATTSKRIAQRKRMQQHGVVDSLPIPPRSVPAQFQGPKALSRPYHPPSGGEEADDKAFEACAMLDSSLVERKAGRSAHVASQRLWLRLVRGRRVGGGRGGRRGQAGEEQSLCGGWGCCGQQEEKDGAEEVVALRRPSRRGGRGRGSTAAPTGGTVASSSSNLTISLSVDHSSSVNPHSQISGPFDWKSSDHAGEGARPQAPIHLVHRRRRNIATYQPSQHRRVTMRATISPSITSQGASPLRTAHDVSTLAFCLCSVRDRAMPRHSLTADVPSAGLALSSVSLFSRPNFRNICRGAEGAV